MNFLKISLVLLAFALFVFACTEASKTNTTVNSNVNKTNTVANTNTPTSTPADELTSAKSVYMEKCVSCHKENGTGGKVTIEGATINAENLTTDKMKNMADEKYFKYIENGIPDEGMPAFKGKLTDEQIKNVVKFIRKEFQGK